MPDFVYGFNTQLFSILLGGFLLFYAYMILPVIIRSFKQNERNKWTSLFSIFLIITSAILFMIPLPDGAYIIPYPISYFALVWMGAWSVVVLISTKLGKTKDESYNKELINGIEKTAKSGGTIDIHNFSYKKEIYRKMIHLCSTLYILAYILAYPIFKFVFEGLYISNPVRAGWEEYINIYVLGSTASPFESAIAVTFLGLLGSFFVQIDAEIGRLRSPHTPFILKKTLQRTRRVIEVNTFGAHIAMVSAFIFSLILLVYDPKWRPQGTNAFVAVVLVSALSDMMAALIGRKFGKKKVFINKDKSYVGCVAGSIFAFACSYPFIGLPLAIITVLIILFNDLILSKINLSDNLTNPLILAITYKLLIFLIQPSIPLDWFLLNL
ncbi:MAG: hypothetical protein ACTSO2_14025 [Promethearchaeota archaeon]